MSDTNQPSNLIRFPQVRKKTGLGKTAIYERMRESTFPLPVAIGPRARAWREDEIDQWIETRPKVNMKGL